MYNHKQIVKFSLGIVILSVVFQVAMLTLAIVWPWL